MSKKDESPLPGDLRRYLRNRSPDRRHEIEQVWDILAQAREASALRTSTDDAWVAVRAATSSDARGGRRMRNRIADRRRMSRGAWITAAAVVALIGFGWMLRPATFETAAGEQEVVRLPDGSIVEMNSESRLQHRRAFGRLPLGLGGSRRVRLDGEAYFRIEHASNPFVVDTRDASVEVIGTQFNVRSRHSDDQEGTVVTLASGRIRLSARAGMEPAIMLADSGAVAHVTSGGVVRRAHDEPHSLDHILAWRSNGFAVVDRPLNSILDEVERRYAVAIEPREGVDLTASISLFYLKGAVSEQILRDICLLQGCTFRRTSRGFALAPHDSTTSQVGDESFH